MRTALITGCNKGIGLELCRQLQARDYEVFATCRAPSPALVELDVNTISEIDVTDGTSLKRLATRLAGQTIDLLINNAGILSVESLDELHLDRIRRQFEVNALAPLRVTAALLPNLKRGAKIVMLTSRLGSLADNDSGGYYGYRMSKVALNMIAVNLANDLRSREIAVLLLHPGMVATDMTGGRGITAEESVTGLVAQIENLTLASSGQFLHMNGDSLPW